MTDDQSPHRRRDDDLGFETGVADRTGEQLPGTGCAPGVGEVQGALEIVTRMEARRQQKVASLVGAAGSELIESHGCSRSMP